MTGVSWGVSAAGVIVAALCWLLLRHHHHAPAITHLISIRLAILGSYVSGCAIALTALGSYVLRFLAWLLGPGGGPSGTWGHTALVIAGAALAATVIVALIRVPRAIVAYIALAAPFVLALTGGALHGLLNVVPAEQVVMLIARKVGG